MKRPWYEFKAEAADPSVADLHIFDAIYRDDPWGDGIVTAKQFVKDLAALGAQVKTIKVHINSPGGDPFVAMAIANALRDQRATKGRQVETIVDGLAASAASLVLMAGAPARVADNAMVMIHNPWTVAIGNASDLLKVAADLESIKGALVKTYQWHSTLSDEEIGALMDAETWMSAEEAVASGFADEVVPGMQAQASIDPAALDRLTVPDRFAARVAQLGRDAAPQPPAPAVATLAEVVALCDAAGLDLTFARALGEQRLPGAEVAARVDAEKARRAEVAARERDVRTLCAKFKVDALADPLVRSGASFDAAREVVAQVAGMVDRVEVDAGLLPDAKGAAAGSKPDRKAIFEARQRRN